MTTNAMTTEQKLELALKEIKRAMTYIDSESAWNQVPDDSTEMEVWRRMDNLLERLGERRPKLAHRRPNGYPTR